MVEQEKPEKATYGGSRGMEEKEGGFLALKGGTKMEEGKEDLVELEDEFSCD